MNEGQENPLAGKQLVRIIDSRLQMSRQDLHAGFFQYGRVVAGYGKDLDAAGNPLAPSQVRQLGMEQWSRVCPDQRKPTRIVPGCVFLHGTQV